jgi:LytS/YehU family sensor histidine kinase
MQPHRQQARLLLFHCLAWGAFVVYEQSIILATSSISFNWPFIALNYVLNAALFYCNSNLLLPGLSTRRHTGWYLYLIAALGVLAAYALLRTELTLHMVPATAPAPRSLWFASIYRGTFFLFASAGYWFARSTIALEVHKRRQEEQLRLAERSLLEANLAFLRNQINPHFLFNSLNFLYAQVYPHSASAAKGILLLSETMRYALHEDTNGKVMLEQEVKHLHNYIEINQLRFNNKLQIDFSVEGSTHFLLILPLVLITFVENCFKHGELADPAHPLVIRLAVRQNQLTFLTKNKKRDGPKEQSTGIGLANTRKRLALIYPGRHTLTTTDEPEFYTCHLTLDL